MFVEVLEVIQQQSVDEAIASTDTLEERPRSHIIKKARGLPRKQVRSPQIEAHDVMMNHGEKTTVQAHYDNSKQCNRQSISTSEDQPG